MTKKLADAQVAKTLDMTQNIAYKVSRMTDEQWRMLAPVAIEALGQNRATTRNFIDIFSTLLEKDWPWRAIPKRVGSWNTLYVKFRRWANGGILDQIIPKMVELGLTDRWPVAEVSKTHFLTTVDIVLDHAYLLRNNKHPKESIKKKVEIWEPFVAGNRVSESSKKRAARRAEIIGVTWNGPTLGRG